MLALGCSVPQVAAEMGRRFTLRPRVAWRHALGWSQWKLAQKYNTLHPGRTAAPAPDLIIIDRSVHTLLAHCFALRRLLDDDYFSLAQHVIGESDVPLWPDHVIYLDAPQRIIEARNGGKFAPDSIFIDAGFNAGVRSYFQRVAEVSSPRVVWLDAAVDATMVRALAAAQLGRWLEQQDCRSSRVMFRQRTSG